MIYSIWYYSIWYIESYSASVWVCYGIYREIVYDIYIEGWYYDIWYICFDVFVCLRFDGWRCDRDMMEMVWRLYLASVWICDGIMVYGIWYV